MWNHYDTTIWYLCIIEKFLDLNIKDNKSETFQNAVLIFENQEILLRLQKYCWQLRKIIVSAEILLWPQKYYYDCRNIIVSKEILLCQQKYYYDRRNIIMTAEILLCYVNRILNDINNEISICPIIFLDEK